MFVCVCGNIDWMGNASMNHARNHVTTTQKNRNVLYSIKKTTNINRTIFMKKC